MKTTLAIITLALVSCGPAPEAWKDTPNPLDTPKGNPPFVPESEGDFGHNWMLR